MQVKKYLIAFKPEPLAINKQPHIANVNVINIDKEWMCSDDIIIPVKIYSTELYPKISRLIIKFCLIKCSFDETVSLVIFG